MPWEQDLAVGRATGLSNVRPTRRERVLDTSDAVRLPVRAQRYLGLITGEWSRFWWGGDFANRFEFDPEIIMKHRDNGEHLFTFRAELREPDRVGKMRIHVLDKNDNSSILQLDWRDIRIDGFDRERYEAVGRAHNQSLRPTGFAVMFEELGVSNAWRGSVPFAQVHPELIPLRRR